MGKQKENLYPANVRIDKVSELTEENFLMSVKIKEQEIRLGNIIKLNEELTAENIRLIGENDDMQAELFRMSENNKIFYNKNKAYKLVLQAQDAELSSIKATRLYKLFKWLGVW